MMMSTLYTLWPCEASYAAAEALGRTRPSRSAERIQHPLQMLVTL